MHFKWISFINSTQGSSGAKASFRKSSGSVDITSGSKKTQQQASVLPALCKAFGPTFLFGALLKLVVDLFTFVSPQILKYVIHVLCKIDIFYAMARKDHALQSNFFSRLLISFVKGDEPMWKGVIYAVAMLLTAMVQTLFLAQYFHRMFLVGMRIRTALVAAIYRKVRIFLLVRRFL